MQNMKTKEIFSTCCAFGAPTDEVWVAKEDCPTKRRLGQRIAEDEKTKEEREECLCSMSRLVCKNYQGIKEVTRNKKKVFKVFCEALES